MVALPAGLMLAATSPSTTKLAAICKVGSIAMRDLPEINAKRRFDAYYAAPDPNGRDLLTICPKLKADIPDGFRIADDDARSRAAVHAPVPGRPVREAVIYFVGVPEISRNARSAVVHFSYSCTGLCGGELEGRYVRTATGWRREGSIRMLSIS